MVKRVKVIILRAPGINCDYETFYAFKKVGASPELVHIYKIIKNEVDIRKFDVLCIPGGFSYGDDISAGKVFSNELKYKIKKKLNDFLKSRKPIIGICNGFQVLVKLGVLPFINFKQKVTLASNDNGRFECRWVYLKKNKQNTSHFLKGIPEVIQLPIAHAEGKFMTDEKIMKKIKEKNLISFQYCDEFGEIKRDYPYNPNGSEENIAGITNESGNILGMMPHPERYIMKYQHPLRMDGNFGILIFRNIVKYARTLH